MIGRSRTVLAAAVLLLAAAGWRIADARPSGPAFDHDKHVGLFPGSCTTCHLGAAEEGSTIWPTAANCATCHDGTVEAVVEWATDSGCHGVDAEVLPGDRSTKNFFEAFGLVARKITVHRSLGERSPDGSRC